MSKESILSNIRESVASNKLEYAAVAYKDLLKHDGIMLEEYKQKQIANKAIIIESSKEKILDDIRATLEKLGSKKVLHTMDLVDNFSLDFSSLGDKFEITPYTKSVDEIRTELFEIDTSIINASCGVADVGIFGIASSPKHPRLASLITKNCIVVLEKKNVVQSIADGIKIARGSGKLPSNIVFIAGASRTADIELQTVFGVHGSQEVYIILV